MDPIDQFKNMSKKKNRMFIIIGVIIVLCLYFAGSCFYSVQEKEQAVVITFGKATDVKTAGMHIKLPSPVQKVAIVPVNETQQMEFGYREVRKNNFVTVPEESKMITGDYNIINIDLALFWKVADPVKYLYNTEKPVEILRNALSNALRSTIGTTPIDEALTHGKTEIQNSVREKLTSNLELYDIGIQILEVNIQDSEAPTEEVKKSFKNVENAKQEKDTTINKATEYKNSELPKAQAQADKIRREAESEKASRINEAEGQVAKFLKIYEKYRNYKEITKTRMYLEAMEEILPDVDVYIMNESGNTQKLLPMKPFTEREVE